MEQQDSNATPSVSNSYRWLQLTLGVVCMVMIANLQYGWTFFVPGIQKTFGWDRASIQVAFTLFVLFETWLVPIEGWFVDKYGPRIVIFVGGVLCGIGWVMNSYATSLGEYYVAQIIAGVGAGGVYGTCPRALCDRQKVLPVGLSDALKISRFKNYCPRCEEVYVPKAR